MVEQKFPALILPPVQRNTDLGDSPEMRVPMHKHECLAERLLHYLTHLTLFLRMYSSVPIQIPSAGDFPMRESENIVSTSPGYVEHNTKGPHFSHPTQNTKRIDMAEQSRSS